MAFVRQEYFVSAPDKAEKSLKYPIVSYFTILFDLFGIYA
jgi:hypothetical protein